MAIGADAVAQVVAVAVVGAVVPTRDPAPRAPLAEVEVVTVVARMTRPVTGWSLDNRHVTHPDPLRPTAHVGHLTGRAGPVAKAVLGTVMTTSRESVP